METRKTKTQRDIVGYSFTMMNLFAWYKFEKISIKMYKYQYKQIVYEMYKFMPKVPV